MVQQIMHGETIAAGHDRQRSPAAAARPAATPTGTCTNGNGSATVTTPGSERQPIRPKWLKTPEAIAAPPPLPAAAKKKEAK